MRKTLGFLCLIFIFCFALTTDLEAQAQKTFWYGLQLRGTAGSGGELPFWLYANRRAAVDPFSSGTSVTLDFHKRLAEDENKFDYGFGATFIGRYSENESVFFNQLYGTIAYGAFQLIGGRFYETTGTINEKLSMGSLALSRNATPLPKVKLGFLNYTPVPFIHGYVEVKGAIAHGWFGKNRRFENAWLHEKYVYVRIGGDFALRPYAGLTHNAIWAGHVDSGFDAPDSFSDFGRVFVASEGDENALPSGQTYALGDHRGIWDFGFYLTLADIDFTVYRQFIYEDKDGVQLERKRDGMWGVSIKLPATNQNFITGILWEYLNTKYQGGPDCPGSGRDGAGGCENYYNNSVYRTGWKYAGRTMGNPLYLPVNSPGIETAARIVGITNNRIIAHHFGVTGNLSSTLKYKLLATWSRNYGVYERIEFLHQFPNDFTTVPEQWSFLANFNYRLPSFRSIRLNLSIAGDAGELYEDSIGIIFGIQFTGSSPF